MNQYYTVDKIAKILSMHPKTIQRYIREGKLDAVKVGKSWQVREQDLRTFMKCSDLSDDILAPKPMEAMASSVVDISVADSEEAFEFDKYLMSLRNHRGNDVNHSAIHTQYLESENKLRITLWGSVSFMQCAFETLSTLMQNKEKENLE